MMISSDVMAVSRGCGVGSGDRLVGLRFGHPSALLMAKGMQVSLDVWRE